MPTPVLRAFLILLLALFVSGAGACRHDFAIENRETPVHVWLTAPGLAEQGGTLAPLIYVGAEKAVDGAVRFPKGTPHIALPTLYIPSGRKNVSVVLQGGALSATEQVKIKRETWLQVIVQERSIRIFQHDEEPHLNLGQEPPKPTTSIPSSSGR